MSLVNVERELLVVSLLPVIAVVLVADLVPAIDLYCYLPTSRLREDRYRAVLDADVVIHGRKCWQQRKMYLAQPSTSTDLVRELGRISCIRRLMYLKVTLTACCKVTRHKYRKEPLISGSSSSSAMSQRIGYIERSLRICRRVL